MDGTTNEARAEAVALSAEILCNVELSEIPLTSIALKTARLARLLNDVDMQTIMRYEAGGYPVEPSGIPPEVWRLAKLANRTQKSEDPKSKLEVEKADTRSIELLEQVLTNAKASLDKTPSDSKYYMGSLRYQGAANDAVLVLSSRKEFLYNYALQKQYELKYSGIAQNVFARIRANVDAKIGAIVPSAVQEFTAIYENLASENPVDWSNAAHGCRRILQGLADALLPTTSEGGNVQINGKTRHVELGPDNYINRLVCYVEDNSNSSKYASVVGTSLAFIGDRLDAIVEAAHKGSHTTITERREADGYVVYTYMVVGDILSLADKTPTAVT